MKYYYKLTDSQGQTYNHTQWDRGVTHTATEKGRLFCSPCLIHLYSSPELAILLNPIHANFNDPRLWKARARILVSERGLKLGAKTVTTIEEVAVPQITTEMKVQFGILCAKQVYKSERWRFWADAWLENKDRSASAAGYAASAAGYAASAAGYAAYAAATAAVYAASAADAAASAASAAGYAASAAATAAAPLDLIKIAEDVVYRRR